jgi:excisionase family DNA binding protein
MTEPAVYTVEEAAGVLRIGRSAAYDAVRRGEIPSIKLGRRLLVPRARLERELLGVDEVDDGPGKSDAPVAGTGALAKAIRQSTKDRGEPS